MASSDVGSAGGLSPSKPVTPEISELAIRFKADAEQQLGAKFPDYVPLSYKTQVVAGVKFFIVVRISKTEFFLGTIEVEIFENLKKEFTFINARVLFTSGHGPVVPPTSNDSGSGGWLPGWNPKWGLGPAKPPSDDDDDYGGGWLPGWNPRWGLGPAKPPKHWGHGPVVPPHYQWPPYFGPGPYVPPHHWGHGPVVPPHYWNPLWGIGPVIPQGSGGSTPSTTTTTTAPTTVTDAAAPIPPPPGGFWFKITPKVAKLAEQFKPQVEEKLGRKLTIYVPVEFQAQGTMSTTLYKIAVETGEFTVMFMGAPQVHKFYTEVTIIVNSHDEPHFVDAVPLLTGLPPIAPNIPEPGTPPDASASSSSKH